MSGEARTIRQARLAIRDAERVVEGIHMAPAMALDRFAGSWYLRKARLALRQAERALAKADDPREPALAPLLAQIQARRPALRPRRKRYRCPNCFRERLVNSPQAFTGLSDATRSEFGQAELSCESCGAEMQPVRRLRRATP